MYCIRTLWYFSVLAPYSCVGQYITVKTLYSWSDQYLRVTLSTQALSKGPPWRILFMGTDDFSLKHLDRLCSKYNTHTIISDLAVCTSQSSIVAQRAKFENLTMYKWPLKVEDIENKFDIGIVVSFGHLIPKSIIDAMPLGILNVHGSLLPRWRGAAPIQYAIMNGDNETGVTVMRINPYKFDTGSIVRQHKCSIGANETTPELRNRLAELGAELLMDCIRDLPKCLKHARPQSEEEATYAPRVTSATAQINWETMTAFDICNLQRAVGYLYPLHTRFQELVVRLYDVRLSRYLRNMTNNKNKTINSDDTRCEIIQHRDTVELFMDSDTDGLGVKPIIRKSEMTTTTTCETTERPRSPGKIIYTQEGKQMFIICAGDRDIIVPQLCVIGKKQCKPADFYNGYLSKLEKRDWVFY